MSKDIKGGENIFGVDDVKERLWREIAAEFLGSLLLVLLGCGSIIHLGNSPAPTHVQIALTFGLVVATLAQSIGHISGCHINPAVTLSLFVSGDCKLIKSVLYIVAQCAGATAGAALLMVSIPSDYKDNLGLTDLSPEISEFRGFFLEAAYTFLLTFVIQAVCDPGRKDIKGSAPLAIGLSITACHLSGIKYTGSSMNPARSFGPALVSNYWAHHWVYWAGPIVGGIVAGLIYRLIFKVKKSEGDSYDF